MKHACRPRATCKRASRLVFAVPVLMGSFGWRCEVFDLFSKGKTIGVFQFESQGMREYLKKLKPSAVEDLIAMNALYRPGPLEYIPTFVKRKNGQEKNPNLVHPLSP